MLSGGLCDHACIRLSLIHISTEGRKKKSRKKEEQPGGWGKELFEWIKIVAVSYTHLEGLNHTEADIRRDIAYWEKLGVLSTGTAFAVQQTMGAGTGQTKQGPAAKQEPVIQQTPAAAMEAVAPEPAKGARPVYSLSLIHIYWWRMNCTGAIRLSALESSSAGLFLLCQRYCSVSWKSIRMWK